MDNSFADLSSCHLCCYPLINLPTELADARS